jgi:hypothetical protein
MTSALAKIDDHGIVINNTNDLTTAVRMIVASNLCPKQYVGKPQDAIIAILAGKQVGWGPIQSLQYIAVINGRPGMYGDGPTGLALGSGKVEWIKEWWERDGETVVEPNDASLKDYPDNLTACWQTKRKDNSESSKVSRFSVSDAKAAGLWGKQGPWCQYTKRMLTCRARAWGLRDNYSDALQGITQAEEWADMQPKRELSPVETKMLAKAEAESAPIVQGEVVESPTPTTEVQPTAPLPDVDLAAMMGEKGVKYLKSFATASAAIKEIGKTRTVTLAAEAYIKELFETQTGA